MLPWNLTNVFPYHVMAASTTSLPTQLLTFRPPVGVTSICHYRHLQFLFLHLNKQTNKQTGNRKCMSVVSHTASNLLLQFPTFLSWQPPNFPEILSSVLWNKLTYVVGSKSFRPDQLLKVTEIKQLCYFSTQSPFISTHFSTDTLTSP